MLKKLVFVFLLVVIGIGVLFFFKKPSETIPIGAYDAVSTVEVHVQMMNIEVAPSPDDQLHVVLDGKQGEEEQFSIDHQAAQLIIMEKPAKGKWTDYIQIGAQPTIQLQVPPSANTSISLTNQDGNSQLKGLDIDSLYVKSSTGKVALRETTVAKIEVRSTDGNIAIHKSTMEKGILSTKSGNVTVKESSGNALDIQSWDGQIKLTEATEQAETRLKSKTGDIHVSYSTAPNSLKLTTSGENVKIALPNYDQQTGQVGEGANQLAIETKDGVIEVK